VSRLYTLVYDHVLGLEGSTRAVGLMRFLLGVLLWSRWAMETAAYWRADPRFWVLTLVFFPLTTAMVLGVWSRVSTAGCALMLWVMAVYYGLELGIDDWRHHHTNLLVLAVTFLAFTPCGQSLSVDRWWAVRAARRAGEAPPVEVGPLWATRLIGALLATVYLWSAFDKCNPAFLSGERLQHIAVRWYLFEVPDAWWFAPACQAAAWITVALEVALPIGLWVPRWQRFFVPLGVLLHGLFYVLLPVGTFSLTMCVLYLAFLPAQVVHRVFDDLIAPERSSGGGSDARTPDAAAPGRRSG
jgi:hypothetical protein